MIILSLDVGETTGMAVVKKNSDTFLEIFDLTSWNLEELGEARFTRHWQALIRAYLLERIVVEWPLVDHSMIDSPLLRVNRLLRVLIHETFLPVTEVKPGTWKTTPYARKDILKYQTREKWRQYRPDQHEKDALGIANWYLMWRYKKDYPIEIKP